MVRSALSLFTESMPLKDLNISKSVVVSPLLHVSRLYIQMRNSDPLATLQCLTYIILQDNRGTKKTNGA